MEGGGEYLLDQFPQLLDDWLFHGGAEEPLDSFRLSDDGVSLGTKQLDVADSSGVKKNHVQADAESSPSPLSDAAIQVFDSLEPAAGMPTTEMEIAEMVRVAAQCGEDKERTLWTEEEQKELLARLDLYAEDDAVARCFKIAFHLPNKTALDVALRCRWLQGKSKTDELAQEDSACRNLIKVKGTKVAKSSDTIYPLSEEALNSKSNKELIEDNKMFLKRIEENLKTGQLANTADYFSYVKTNMDAIERRGSEFGISMAMPPIDEQGLQEILQTRYNSSDLIEDA